MAPSRPVPHYRGQSVEVLGEVKERKLPSTPELVMTTPRTCRRRDHAESESDRATRVLRVDSAGGSSTSCLRGWQGVATTWGDRPRSPHARCWQVRRAISPPPTPPSRPRSQPTRRCRSADRTSSGTRSAARLADSGTTMANLVPSGRSPIRRRSCPYAVSTSSPGDVVVPLTSATRCSAPAPCDDVSVVDLVSVDVPSPLQ